MGAISDLFATQTPTPNAVPIADGSGTLDAWVSGFMLNPMTNYQDMIVGGIGGTPERLGVGSAGYVLTVGSSGVIEWAAATGGFTNPMTTYGDLIWGGVAGAAQRLGIGTLGQVLTVGSGGAVEWDTPSPGVSGANPTAVVGLAAVNGSALTFMRSDAAPPIDQGIVPTWTGAHKFTALTTMDLGSSAGALPSTIASNVTLRLANADTVAAGIEADAFGAGNGFILHARLTGGTRASQSATPSGQAFFTLAAYGYDTALLTAAAANYQIVAGSTWASGNRETKHSWRGTPSGSPTAATWMTLDGANGLIVTNGINGTVIGGVTKAAGSFTTLNATGAVDLGAAGGTTGIVKFEGTTSGTVSLSVQDAAGTWTMKLPNSAGTSGYVLTTDGAGVCSWSSQSGAADYLALQVFF